ncbi:MAG: DHH family phosphoesterase [Elusimicrobia bacterium]|nr:DHH family phosphoesterase [Elusimicrobiota bacterium]MDE2312732.1 DHH family phosphoesterase [Elusimicrobiota bacterium]
MKAAFHAKRLLRYLTDNAARLRPLVILTHDHPDPDSLASAWALAHLAQHYARVRSRVVYGGMVGRSENRLMMERLEVPATQLKKGELAQAPHLALVDTQPPFKNNRCPPRRHPQIIVDHHPRHSDTQGDLVLIDESVGATTTILAEAILESGIRVPKRLATAMVYGIGSETQNLGREAGPRDLAAYRALWPKAQMKALWRISYPRRPAFFFSTLGRGIKNAFVVRDTVGVHLGALPNPDLVAQIADFLLTLEGMRWSLVSGRYAGRLHVSLRSSDPGAGAGRLLKRLLGGGNRGGGHAMIAGGSLEVGESAAEHDWRQAEERLAEGFLKSRGINEESTPRTHPFKTDL